MRSARRTAAFLLSCFLLFPVLSGCGAEPALAEGEYITAAEYTAEEILAYFSETVFGSEYGGWRGTVCKWTEPVLLWIHGECGEGERAVIDDLMERLNGIGGFPGISYAKAEKDANFLLYFVMQGELADYFGESAENASGRTQFSFRKSSGEILTAKVGVASNITPQRAKASVICEEILQALGPASDSYTYPESVFYEGYNASLRPAEIDWAILTLLYHKTITPGMAYGDAMDTAAALLGIPAPGVKEEETTNG